MWNRIPHLAVGVLASVLFASVVIAQPGAEPGAPVYHSVTRGDVAVTLIERGEIDAVNSVAVSCKVRAREKAGVAGTIMSLVEEGTVVKKGEIVARLDDAPYKDRLEQGHIGVKEKQAQLAQAETELRLAELQSRADLEAAEAGVEAAEADLKRFNDGDDGQLRKLEIKLQQAKVALQIAQTRLNRSAAKAEAVELRLEVQLAEGNVEAATLDLKKQRERDPAVKRQLEAKVRVAKFGLEAGKLQLAGKRAQQEAMVVAAKANLQLEEARCTELRDDLESCTLRAPSDGVVIYYRPEMTRFGGQHGVIAVGEAVREGQRLFLIPDLSQMQVKTKISESIVPRVAIGQKATVHVDAIPQKSFQGTVRSVNAVADVSDWNRRDVKLYPASIALSAPIEGLKPGMTARVEMLLEVRKDVLRIPVRAIVKYPDGDYCQVRSDTGNMKRKLVLGAQNLDFAEVKDGLKEGETVLVNPPLNLPARRERS